MSGGGEETLFVFNLILHPVFILFFHLLKKSGNFFEIREHHYDEPISEEILKKPKKKTPKKQSIKNKSFIV